MAFPRSQYKLHPALPTIVEVDKGYYFGQTYCTKDLKPADLLRVAPLSPILGYSPTLAALDIRGKTLAIQRSGNIVSAAGSTHSTSGLMEKHTLPFLSQTGLTSGKRFVVIAPGNLCEIDENDVLTYRQTVADNSSLSYRTFVTGAVIDESANELIVALYCRIADGSTPNRTRILRVNKSTWAIGVLISDAATQPDAGSFSTANKYARYLGMIGDKHLMVLTPMNGSTSNLPYMSFVAFDAAGNWYRNGATSGLLRATSSNYNVCGTASSLVPKEGTGGEFYLTIPGTNPTVPVTIERYTLPTELVVSGTTSLTTSIASIPRKVMTLTNMPNGVSLLPACPTATPSYSSQFMPFITNGQNGKKYLNIVSSFSGIQNQESEASYVMANIGLFTFEISADGESLIYQSHTLNGFGYGLRINELLWDDNGRTLLVSNSTGFAVWTFSDALGKFVPSEWRSVPAGLRRLALDLNYKIWVEDVDGLVYLFDLDLSASVNITFDRTNVVYEGTTVPIKAYVEAMSFAGNRITRNIRLVATGCTFDDGTTTKNVVTSPTGTVEVPLFVNGSGIVSLNGYLV